MDCLFCKIIAGEIPSAKVYENDKVYAFRDINPQAPTHILIVPKEHISDASELEGKTAAIAADIFEAAAIIARAEGLTNGYRVVTNCGPDACQSVHHLHFHLLGGKQLAEKMS